MYTDMDENAVPSGQWIKQRPDLIADASSAVSIEHLGGMEYLKA